MLKKSLIWILSLFLLLSLFYFSPFSYAEKPKRKITPVRKVEKDKLNLPAWKNIENYKIADVIFNKTTQEQFNIKYPFIKDFEDLDQGIRVYTYKPSKNTDFSSVKFGFEDNILTWVDIIPGLNIAITEVIEEFGTPLGINTKASKYLDYYDYGDLTISLSKDKGNIYTFTLSKPLKRVDNNADMLKIKIPALKELVLGKMDKFIPGQTKLSAVKNLYPAFKQLNSGMKVFNENNENDTSAIFRINAGLTGSEFKRIELIFNNDVLNWIDLVPKKLTITTALTIFGKKYQIDNSNSNIDFYNFKNIVLTVSKRDKIVLNIGLLGSINSNLREALVSWDDLNTKSINNIKLDVTTEKDLDKLFPGLVAQKQSEANIDIFKVTEGISSKGYQTIFFVFKNKKLTSVDFIPDMELSISDVIKKYGSNYELDTKSDKDLDFYTFNKVIVSVLKDSKVVNSLGLF
ncbi:MAG: hypothetical protein AB1782_16890 [Cyanobacteriota bacterium]